MRSKLIYFIFITTLIIPLACKLINEAAKIQFEKGTVLCTNVDLRQNQLESARKFVRTYDEKFCFRSMLIRQFLWFKMNILMDSPLPKKLVIGKHGFLFLTDYNSMDDYRNVNHFTPDVKRELSEKFQENLNFCTANGIKYVIVIVPEKQRVYPELLPLNISQVRKTSRFDDFTEYLKSCNIDLPLLYLSETLISHKDSFDDGLYFRKESHWNYIAAKIAFDKVREFLNDRYRYNVSFVDYKWEDYLEDDLDLAIQLGESRFQTERTKKPVSILNYRILDHLNKNDSTLMRKQKKPNYLISRRNLDQEGNVLIYRDSYTSFWSDLFVDAFYDTRLVWDYDLNLEYIERVNPDLIVHEIAERHLEYLIY